MCYGGVRYGAWSCYYVIQSLILVPYVEGFRNKCIYIIQWNRRNKPLLGVSLSFDRDYVESVPVAHANATSCILFGVAAYLFHTTSVFHTHCPPVPTNAVNAQLCSDIQVVVHADTRNALCPPPYCRLVRVILILLIALSHSYNHPIYSTRSIPSSAVHDKDSRHL
jgi:hypothetical protein